jgi:hypothetical protein
MMDFSPLRSPSGATPADIGSNTAQAKHAFAESIATLLAFANPSGGQAGGPDTVPDRSNVADDTSSSQAQLAFAASITMLAVRGLLQSSTAPSSANSADCEKPAMPASPPATDPQVQAAINGNSTTLPAADEKAPPGMSVDDINKLDGGLLGKLGNQNLQGQGTIKELLSKKYGGDVTKDPDAAWRAYRALVAVKNETNSDGSAKPSDVIHNGNIGGFTPSGEAPHGSEAGSLQDLLLHDRTPGKLESDPSPQTGANGGSASGIETFGHEVEKGFKTFGNDLKNVFVGIGHGIEDVGKGIGSGLKDLFTGHIAQAGSDVVNGFTSGASDVIKPVTNLVGDTLDNIPVVGQSMGNVVKGVGNGATDILTGVGNAATDASHGNFGNAARDIIGGGQNAFSDVTKPIVNFASTAIDQTPLGDTAFGQAFSNATNWVGDKLSGVYDSLSNTLGAPAEHTGDTASDLLDGNLSKAGQDAMSTVTSTATAVATVAPLLIPGAGEVIEGAELAGEGIAGVEGALGGAEGAAAAAGDGASGAAASSAWKAFDNLAGDLKKGYDTGNHLNDILNNIGGNSPPSGDNADATR